MKKQNKFPPGWNEERVQNVIAYYDQQTEDEAVAEAEIALRNESSMLIEVPMELVPTVRELIAQHTAQKSSSSETKRLRLYHSGAKARNRLTTFMTSSATMSTSSAVL